MPQVLIQQVSQSQATRWVMVMQTLSWKVAAGSPICQVAKKGILQEGVIFEDCATRLLP